MNEFEKDKIEFERLMEFIEVCYEHDFESKHDITINAHNKAVERIDEIATKYNLNNKMGYGPWYELYDLWPRMKRFFSGEEINENFNKALSELYWLSDQEEPMKEFCEFIEKYAEYIKGQAICKVINLDDYGFTDKMPYVAYDDRNGNFQVLPGTKFIEYIKEDLKTLDIEYKILWIKEINKIISKY